MLVRMAVGVVRAVCPACGAEVRDGARACPRCGSAVPVAPATTLAGRAGRESDGGDVPDLVLPGPAASARVRARDPGASRPGAAASAPSSPSTQSEQSCAIDPNLMDADDLGGGADDVKLDLDVVAPAPHSGHSRQAAPARPVAAGESRGEAPGRGGGAPRAPWGTETLARLTAPSTPAADALDPFEVRAVADYGSRPRRWWETPRYAYRVITRKAELRRAIALRKADAERAETAAEDALIAFGQAARAVVDASPASATASTYAAALQAVGATEDLFRARDTALSAETQAHDKRRAESEQQIGDLEAQLAARRAEENAVAAELAAVEAVAKRAEARVKRAEIEIRNAGQLQASGAPQAPESRRGQS